MWYWRTVQHGVGAERGDRGEHVGLAVQPLAADVLHQPLEGPVGREERGELSGGIAGGGDEVGEQEHRLGDDVVVVPAVVETVGAVLGRVGEEDLGERWRGSPGRHGGGGDGDDADGGGETDEEGLAHVGLLGFGTCDEGRPGGRSHRLRSVRVAWMRCRGIDAVARAFLRSLQFRQPCYPRVDNDGYR